MKLRYVFGFFLSLFIMVGLLDLLYYQSYQLSKNNIQIQQKENTKEDPGIQTDGKVKKNNGYYLMNQNGYVTVFFSDKETIFQYTSITFDSLPNQIKEEITKGKWMESTKELYSFLENYSS